MLQSRCHNRKLFCFHKTILLYFVVPSVLLVLLSTLAAVDAIDVKWTPNPNDNDNAGAGPLPLSSKQRQQLLQLEQTIMNSPDPQATLEQIASTNSMSSTELYNMLQRNHNDMEQSGDMKAGSPQRRSSTMITAVIWNAITTIVGIIWQIIHRNPKLTTTLGILVASTLYISTILVPKNGLILNQHTARSIITKGPTSFFYPPTSYIQQLLFDSPNENKLFRMIQTKKITNDNEEENDDGNDSRVPIFSYRELWKYVDFSKLEVTDVNNDLDGDGDLIVTTKTWRPSKVKNKMSKVQIVTSSQQIVDVMDIYRKLPKTVVKSRILGNDDQNVRDAIIIREEIVDWCIYHAANICQTQDITEFAGSENFNQRQSEIKMFSNYKNSEAPGANRGILIAPGLGDFQRYGIVPLYVETNDIVDEDDDTLYLTLTVADGAHFDGQIHISIHPIFEVTAEKCARLPTKFLVRASIIVPMKGKAPNSKIAQHVTSELVHSIVQSIQIRVQQSMVRSKQSNSYSQQASKRAVDRRKNRTTLERQMEEMAIDRRRKWQHKNPSGSSNYRPSGERMRNPNSAVSFR
jgi:hypothetical protein